MRRPPRARFASRSTAGIATVGPATSTPRLPEREYCSITGALAALSLSELFLSFAAINIEAKRRIV